MGRFVVAENYFKACYALGPAGNYNQIAKGMAFVQMYAIYEYTVTSAVRAAVDAVALHGHPIKELTPCLLSLFLDPELQSLQNSTVKTAWAARLKLLDRASSNDPARINNTVFPIDGTHFRASQLQLIFDVFGIKGIPAKRRRHLGRINDVVENRNAIAHGRDTAENIGRTHTRADILLAFRQMQSVCLFLIKIIKDHCGDASRHRRK